MAKQKTGEKLIPLLRSAVGALTEHKIIFFPYLIIACLQFLILEILYFYPRYPLNIIFEPIVRTLWTEEFLHYPNNFILLPKLFQYLQMPFIVFIGSFLVAVSILIVKKENAGERVLFRQTCQEVWSQYVHIVVAHLIMFFMVWTFFRVYNSIYERALRIQSTAGVYFQIKIIVIHGAPYLNLLWTVMVSSIFAYVMPLVVIEKQKVFSAIIQNFRILWGSFWLTFGLVFLPTLLYLPILWLRNIFSVERFFPEVSVLLLAMGILVTILIDAVVYTSITVRYLWKTEKR